MPDQRELAANVAAFLLSQIKSDKNLVKWALEIQNATGLNPFGDPESWEGFQALPKSEKTYAHNKLFFKKAVDDNPFWKQWLMARDLVQSIDAAQKAGLARASESVKSPESKVDFSDVESFPASIRIVSRELRAKAQNLERLDIHNDPARFPIIINVAAKPADEEEEEYVSQDPSFAPPVNISISAADDEPDWEAEIKQEAAEGEAEESSLVTVESVDTYFTRLGEAKEREEANNVIYVDGKGYRKAEYERMMAERGENVKRADSHDFGPAKEEEDLKKKVAEIKANNEKELERLDGLDADSLLDAMFSQKAQTGPAPKPQNDPGQLSDNPDDEPSLWDAPRSEESLKEAPAPSGGIPQVNRRPVDMDDLSDDPDDDPQIGRFVSINAEEETSNEEPGAPAEEKVPDSGPKKPEGDFVFGIPEGYSEDADETEDVSEVETEPAAQSNSVFGEPKEYEPVFERSEKNISSRADEPDEEFPEDEIVADDDFEGDEIADDGGSDDAPVSSSQDADSEMVDDDDFDGDEVVADDDFDDGPASSPKRAEIPQDADSPDVFEDHFDDPGIPEALDDPFGDGPEMAEEPDEQPVPEASDDPFGENWQESDAKPDILTETMRKSPIQAKQAQADTEPVKEEIAPQKPAESPKKGSFIRVVEQPKNASPASAKPSAMAERFGKPVMKVVKESEWK